MLYKLKTDHPYLLVATLFLLFLLFFFVTLHWGSGAGVSRFVNVSPTTSSKSLSQVTSLDPQVKVVVVSQATLAQELEKDGFWSEKGVSVPLGDYAFRVTANSLSIKLVPTSQAYGVYFANNNKTPISSFGVNRDAENNIELLIWLNLPAISAQDLSFAFNRAVFTALFDLTHWQPPGVSDSERINYIENMHRKILRNLPLPLSVIKN